MKNFEKLEQLFARPDQEVQDVLASVSLNCQLIDIHVAKVLGISKPEVVLLVRKLLESYSWFLEQTIGQDRLHIDKYESLSSVDSNQEERTEVTTEGSSTSYLPLQLEVNDRQEIMEQIRQENLEKEAYSHNYELRIDEEFIEESETEEGTLDSTQLETNESIRVENKSQEMLIDKAVLVVAECGSKDYGIKEVTEQMQDVLLIKNDNEEYKKEATGGKGKNKESHEICKNSLDESIHAPNKRKIETAWAGNGTRFQNSKDRGDYMVVTVWDLSVKTQITTLKEQMRKFGEIIEAQVAESKFRKAVVLKIRPWNEEWRKRLSKAWSIELEEERLARVNIGNMNVEALRRRERFRAIIRNVPCNAMESLLLRYLRRTHAKNVHIRKNKNGNPSSIAIVDFATAEDKIRAFRHTVYYGNTKLRWDNPDQQEEEDRRSHSSNFYNQEYEKKKELNRRKRRFSEVAETYRSSKEDQWYDRKRFIKRRRTDNYDAASEIYNLRKQVRELEHQMNRQAQRNNHLCKQGVLAQRS